MVITHALGLFFCLVVIGGTAAMFFVPDRSSKYFYNN